MPHACPAGRHEEQDGLRRAMCVRLLLVAAGRSGRAAGSSPGRVRRLLRHMCVVRRLGAAELLQGACWVVGDHRVHFELSEVVQVVRFVHGEHVHALAAGACPPDEVGGRSGGGEGQADAAETCGQSAAAQPGRDEVGIEHGRQARGQAWMRRSDVRA